MWNEDEPVDKNCVFLLIVICAVVLGFGIVRGISCGNPNVGVKPVAERLCDTTGKK